MNLPSRGFSKTASELFSLTGPVVARTGTNVYCAIIVVIGTDGGDGLGVFALETNRFSDIGKGTVRRCCATAIGPGQFSWDTRRLDLSDDCR